MKPAMDPDERDELLEHMGRLARDAFPDTAKPAASATGKRQLKLALAARRPSWRAGRWTAVALAAVLALAALLVFRVYPSELAYEVDGVSPSDGGYLQGTRQNPAVAHFTDGTEVRVGAGARARIVDVERRGARIALEQGRAHLRVIHRPEARWSVEAGPFSIAVTGTEFDAEWSAADGVLVVEMRSGAVIVRGPLAADGIGVHGGQRLVASVPEGRLHIEPLDTQAPRAGSSEPGSERTAREPAGRAESEHANVVAQAETRPGAARPEAPTSVDAPSVEPAAIDARPHDEVPGVEPGEAVAKERSGKAAPPRASEAAALTPPASWGKRVASGDFRGVISDAEGRGLQATLAEAPLGDLVALADAARYTGNSSIARDALASQRRRYPSSADAKAAAFFLGRIAEDTGSTGEAIDWYERYLSEAPRGAFAAEALGREMVAASRSRGAAAGAAVARRYLDRFPGGPYADRARKLAAGP